MLVSARQDMWAMNTKSVKDPRKLSLSADSIGCINTVYFYQVSENRRVQGANNSGRKV
jgi:hypothetical protein